MALDEGSPQCTIERPETSISLRLDAADELGALDLVVRRDANLRIVVGNSASTDATVTVRARSWGEAGEMNVVVGSTDVAAGSSANLDLEARLLGLPGGAFDNSASLVLQAEGVFGDGRRQESEPMRLAFHPTGSGWQLYDLATRDSVYQGGALTAAARATREAALARLPPGTRLAATTRGTVEGHPAGWSPPLDGPPDPEGGAQ